jgi:hypothetical protein
MKPENTPQRDANQGEGDKVAARHYNEQLREFVEGGKVQPAARAAETFVEQDPLAAKRAEEQAKRGPTATKVSLEELVAKGKTVIGRIRPLVERAVGKLRARAAHK